MMDFILMRSLKSNLFEDKAQAAVNMNIFVQWKVLFYLLRCEDSVGSV